MTRFGFIIGGIAVLFVAAISFVLRGSVPADEPPRGFELAASLPLVTTGGATGVSGGALFSDDSETERTVSVVYESAPNGVF